MRRTRRVIIQEIEDAERARADALAPAFHHPPRLGDAAFQEIRLRHLHLELDKLDARARRERIRERLASEIAALAGPDGELLPMHALNAPDWQRASRR